MSTFSAADITVSTSDSVAEFSVVRTGITADLQQPASVEYYTADATALSGQDYVETSGTLDFLSGETKKSVIVAILADNDVNSEGISFLLQLQKFGAASCYIHSASSGDGAQSYWMVEGTGSAISIPDASDAEQPLLSQADTDQMAPPRDGTTAIAVPRAYVRVGSARPDMNPAERIILNSAAYQATLVDLKKDTYHKAGNGAPTEIGANELCARPRGIHRAHASGEEISSEDLAELMEDNQHLDGIFQYSDNAYLVTVKGNASTVVHGTSHVHVGGDSRIHNAGRKVETYSSSADGKLFFIEGAGLLLGQYTDYSFRRSRALSVNAAQTSSYTMDASFAANFSTHASISTAVDLEIKQGAAMTVTGLSATGSIDLKGQYTLIDPIFGTTANAVKLSTQAMQGITFSISSRRYAKAAKYAGRGLAGAAVALAASVAGVATASVDDPGEDWANAERIENMHVARLLQAGFPALTGVLGAVGAAISIGLAVMQTIEDNLPFSDKTVFDIDPHGITLKVGETTRLYLREDYIRMEADDIEISAKDTLTTDAKTHDSDWTDWTHQGKRVAMLARELKFNGNMDQAGPVRVNGAVQANAVAVRV